MDLLQVSKYSNICGDSQPPLELMLTDILGLDYQLLFFLVMMSFLITIKSIKAVPMMIVHLNNYISVHLFTQVFWLIASV